MSFFVPESSADLTLHLVACFLSLPSVTDPQALIVFHDFDTFEEHWSDGF